MNEVLVIGWGSLIWDIENLAPHVVGDWRMRAGPRIPLEFSRISPKRLMSLTVIPDSAHGAPCPTHVIASAAQTTAEAAAHLAARERAPLDRIGLVCRETGALRSSDDGVARVVADWCEATGARGAVWTDLPGNFQAETGMAFTVSRGLAYLRTLRGANLAEAKRYIDSAPVETDTPLRRALAANAWWRGL